MAEQLRYEFVDGTVELVRRGSRRYWELTEDGHTPVGVLPESDGISDAMETYLAARFGVSDAGALAEVQADVAGVQGDVSAVEADVAAVKGEVETGRLSESGLSATIASEGAALFLDIEEAPPTPEQYREGGETTYEAAFGRLFAAGKSLAYVPPSPVAYDVAGKLTLPVSMSMRVDGTLRATSTIAGAVIETGTSVKWQDKAITGAGTIDCNDLADHGIKLPFFLSSRIEGVTVLDPKSHGVVLGDTAFTQSNEHKIIGVKVDRNNTGAVPAGSYGFWIANSYDGTMIDCVAVGAETSFRVDKTDNKFVACHGWGWAARLPTTIFDDNAQDNEWIACTADSPTTYGWRLRTTNTKIIGGMVFLNTAAPDNAVTGVHFDNAFPSSTLIGIGFKGVDATHRLARDTNLTPPISLLKSFGCWNTNTATATLTTDRTTFLQTRDLTFADKGTLPTATVNQRGQMVYVAGDGVSTADKVYACLRSSVGGYSWVQIATA